MGNPELTERTASVTLVSTEFPEVSLRGKTAATHTVEIRYEISLLLREEYFRNTVIVNPEADDEIYYDGGEPAPQWLCELALRHKPDWYALRPDGTMPDRAMETD